MTELHVWTALSEVAELAPDRDLAEAAWRTARRRRQRRASAGAAALVAAVAGAATGLGLHAAGPTPAPPVASGPPATGPSAHWSDRTGPVTRTTFASPSGNITCLMSSREVVCDVAQQSWRLTATDLASCGHAALAGIALPAAGQPRFDCRTDVLVPDPHQVLAYGDSIVVGEFTCASATTGVTCQDRRTGHRIFVSRQSFRMA